MQYEFEVLTVRDLDFKDDSGRPVKGQQIWCLGETSDPAWHGNEVVKIWIPDDHPLENTAAGLVRGDRIRVSYNRRGKAEEIVRV